MPEELNPAGQKALENASNHTRAQLRRAMEIVKGMSPDMAYNDQAVLAVAQILATNWQTEKLRPVKPPPA
jgi:hypothetical protein